MASKGNDDRLDQIMKLIKGISPQHNEDFKKLEDRLSSFEKTMSFLNGQFENFKKTTENFLIANTKLEKINEDLIKELKDAKRELEISKNSVNDLEQYGRRYCIEIRGIPNE